MHFRPTSSFSLEYFSENIPLGNREVLSKALTLLESRLPKDRYNAIRLLSNLLPHTGKSFRLGITGMPGVGKSTFIESFGQILMETGQKLAILAVDPSSVKTGGSILGDKTRMEQLSKDERVYIRPIPSSLNQGGINSYLREMILVCEAAGFDFIIVETVGVGQAEVSISGVVDYVLTLLLPGSGDELQGMKKGLLEIANGILINKAEGDQKTLAITAARQIHSAFNMLLSKQDAADIYIGTVSAISKQSIEEWYQHLINFKLKAQYLSKRLQQNEIWFQESIKEIALSYFLENDVRKDKVSQLLISIQNQKIHPLRGIEEMMNLK